MLDGLSRGIEPGDDRIAQLVREDGFFFTAADRFDAVADGRCGARRQRHRFFHQIVEGIERRLTIARPPQRAGMIARLLPQHRCIGNEGFQ